MILGISILLLVLVIFTWLFVMYATYKIEAGINPTLTSNSFIDFYRKIERLIRRGYYLVLLYGKESISWSNKKVTSGVTKVIPSSAMAFEEKDELTGLHAGPMSFYLQSISDSKPASPHSKGAGWKKSRKRLSSSEKMI